MNNLRPCSRCGAEVLELVEDFLSDLSSVRCQSCGFEVAASTAEEADSDWNELHRRKFEGRVAHD